MTARATATGAAASVHDPVAVAELAAYEGIRRGDLRAFATLARSLQPGLEWVAGDLTGGQGAADALIVRTWAVALGGLEMFAWRCRLRAWVVGILIGLTRESQQTIPWAAPQGRAVHRPMIVLGRERSEGQPAVGRPRPPGSRREPAPGPEDWRDLPWGARWTGIGTAVDAALASMTQTQRLLLALTAGLGWPDQDARDALALTASGFAAEYDAATRRLHATVAAHIGGEPAGGAVRARQVGQALTLLPEPAPAATGAVPPGILNVYRQWRRALPRWRRAALARRLRVGAFGP